MQTTPTKELYALARDRNAPDRERITINILETNLRLAESFAALMKGANATGGAIKDADNHAHKTVGTAGTACKAPGFCCQYVASDNIRL